MTSTQAAVAFTTLVLLGLAAPAHALTSQQEAEYRRDCTADYSRLCSAYNPGSPEVEQCFQQRIKEVSPRCQATIAKYRPRGRR